MTRFARKKPVTIECMKFDGFNFDEVKKFCGDVAETHSNVVLGCDELFIKTLEGNHHASEGDVIIKGVNGEFYPCKPDIFDKTYEYVDAPEAKPTDFVHSFSWALDRLKEGKRIHRSGWNGKRMFLTLQEGSTVTGTMMRNKPARDFYGDGEVKICPHIDMKAADGSYVVGWLASQTDMLANDWAIAD